MIQLLMYTKTISPIPWIYKLAMFPSTLLDDFCGWRIWYIISLGWNLIRNSAEYTTTVCVCFSGIASSEPVHAHIERFFASRDTSSKAIRSSKRRKSSHFNFDDYGDDFDDESTLSWGGLIFITLAFWHQLMELRGTFFDVCTIPAPQSHLILLSAWHEWSF